MKQTELNSKQEKTLLDPTKQEVLDNVIKNLKQNGFLWDKGYCPIKSYNYTTNKAYNGSNRLILNEYSTLSNDPRWLTFNQIKELGFHLNKGSKSVKLFFFNVEKIILETEEEVEKYSTRYIIHTDEVTGEKYIEKIHMSNFNVFNASNVTGIEEFVPPPPKITNDELDSFIDKIIEISPIKINNAFTLDAPHYRPWVDEIYIPDKSICKSTEERFSILVHELAHASGHNTRLNRPKGFKFGSKEYAREELVAALTEMFIAQEYGIKGLQSNHQAYIDSWITVLKDNPDELFKASGLANKSCDWLIENIFDKAQKELSDRSNVEVVENLSTIQESNKSLEI